MPYREAKHINEDIHHEVILIHRLLEWWQGGEVHEGYQRQDGWNPRLAQPDALKLESIWA